MIIWCSVLLHVHVFVALVFCFLLSVVLVFHYFLPVVVLVVIFEFGGLFLDFFFSFSGPQRGARHRERRSCHLFVPADLAIGLSIVVFAVAVEWARNRRDVRENILNSADPHGHSTTPSMIGHRAKTSILFSCDFDSFSSFGRSCDS